MENSVVSWLSQFGAPALFALLALGVVGLPIPDETILAMTGVLIAQGRLNPVTMALAALMGAITGVTVSYGLGRFAGLPLLLRYGARWHIDTSLVTRVERWFEKSGKWLLTFGYFIPGVRHFTAMVAGTSRLPIGMFMLFAYAGAILWVSCFLTIGYVLGDQWPGLLSDLDQHLWWAALFVIPIAGAWVYWKMRRRSGRESK